MSSPQALDPPLSKPDSKPLNNRIHGNKQQNNSKKRFKHDRSCRKRSKSFSGCGPINPKPVLPSKFLLGGNINDPLNLNSLQDEEINRAMNAVTPKSSPLPTPPRRKMPIEVMVSPNTQDPLHLMDCKNDKEYEEHLCSPVKKGKKKRLKKRRTMSSSVEEYVPDSSGNSEARTPEAEVDSAKIPEEPEVVKIVIDPLIVKSENTVETCRPTSFDLERDKKEKPKRSSEEASRMLCSFTNVSEQPLWHKINEVLKFGLIFQKYCLKLECINVTSSASYKLKSEEASTSHTIKKFKNSMDKIVSPVVPQPGAWLKRSNSVKLPKPRPNKVTDTIMPAFKEKNKRFQYGNYDRYYGYRNSNNETDHRLRMFSYHPHLFENKDILDIGCNIGHITLSVARDFRARTVTGIDIDPKLISIARKNIKHYVKTANNSPLRMDGKPNTKLVAIKNSSEFFPISLPILYGPIDIPGLHDIRQDRDFPQNVNFKQCNYVLEDESLLSLEQPQFDVILCLSTTKWIHLNWGDNGLKLAFRRMYEQLRPGGKLILEPQHWAGYKSKKKLTENIYRNYNAIEFFPDKFRDYLLSPAVGFAKSEILGFPQHKNIGFRRPIQVFTKSTMFPSERVEATPSNPVYNDSVYQKIMQIGKYEPRNRSESRIEHVYTNLLQPTPRHTGIIEESGDISEDLCQTLNHDNRIQIPTSRYNHDSIANKLSSHERICDIASECSCDIENDKSKDKKCYVRDFHYSCVKSICKPVSNCHDRHSDISSECCDDAMGCCDKTKANDGFNLKIKNCTSVNLATDLVHCVDKTGDNT